MPPPSQPKMGAIPGGTAYSFTSRAGPKAASPTKTSPSKSGPKTQQVTSPSKAPSLWRSSASSKASTTAPLSPSPHVSDDLHRANGASARELSSSLRGTVLHNAQNRLATLVPLAERLRDATREGVWKGTGLTETMLGISGGGGDMSADINEVELTEELCIGLTAVRDLVSEADEVQKMLEAQCIASRGIAVKSVNELTEARKEHDRALADAHQQLAACLSAEQAQALQRDLDAAKATIASQAQASETVRHQLTDTLAQHKVLQASAAKAQREAVEEAVAQERASWETKYRALETEYSDLEPRYTQAMDAQRRRIRLLEQQLKSASATGGSSTGRGGAAGSETDEERVVLLRAELQAMAGRLATATSERDAAWAETRAVKEAQEKLEVELQTQANRLYLEEAKLTEFESGLVDALDKCKRLETQLATQHTTTDHVVANLEKRLKLYRDVTTRLADLSDMRLVTLTRPTKGTETEEEARPSGAMARTTTRVGRREGDDDGGGGGGGSGGGHDDVTDVAPLSVHSEHSPTTSSTSPSPSSGFGLSVKAHDAGVVVDSVRPDGPAALAGLAPGDFIAAVNGVWTVGRSVQTVASCVADAGTFMDVVLVPRNLVQDVFGGQEEEEEEGLANDELNTHGTQQHNGMSSMDAGGHTTVNTAAMSGVNAPASAVSASASTGAHTDQQRSDMTSPFAVLLTAATARVSMKVVVEASLVDLDSDSPYADHATQHDGSTGTIVEVDTDDHAALVEFHGGLAAWLPLAALAYIPPGKMWMGWRQSASAQRTTAFIDNVVASDEDHETIEQNGDRNGTHGSASTSLDPALREKIAAAVGEGRP
eukprot:m.90248 g.90248  ORF g.90248 m.90248 type:complete len:831 (+) comp9848_c0_seq1:753-3245(+)